MNLIPKSDWTQYLNRIARSLEGLRAEIEVASLELGDQIAAIDGLFIANQNMRSDGN